MSPYRLTIFAIKTPLIGEFLPIVDLRSKDTRLFLIPYMRGLRDYSYNLFMGNPFRTTRTGSRPPLPEAQSPQGALPPLVPDIITARQRQGASSDDASRFDPLEQPLDELSIVEARHPDVARAITLLWGYPEMNEYFERIWVADGFHAPIDPDAMSELMLLARLHQAITPQRPGRNLASILSNNRWQQPASSPAPDPWREVPPRR
jgi:hypothetical protein